MEVCAVALGCLQGLPAERVDPHAAARLPVCLQNCAGGSGLPQASIWLPGSLVCETAFDEELLDAVLLSLA